MVISFLIATGTGALGQSIGWFGGLRCPDGMSRYECREKFRQRQDEEIDRLSTDIVMDKLHKDFPEEMRELERQYEQAKELQRRPRGTTCRALNCTDGPFQR